MIFIFILFTYSIDPLDIDDAKHIIDILYNIETDLNSHLTNLQDFSSKFDFLLSNDQKLRNKIHFIQNKDQIQKQKSEIIEIPIKIKDGIQEKGSFFFISNSTSFLKRISFNDDDKSFIFYPNKKNSVIKKIVFDETKFQDCIVKDFQILLKYENQPNFYLTDQTLYLHQASQHYEFPNHVIFDSIIIKPYNIWGNESLICIPKIHVFGDKIFNM